MSQQLLDLVPAANNEVYPLASRFERRTTCTGHGLLLEHADYTGMVFRLIVKMSLHQCAFAKQAVLQALSQNRVGKDNAAKEFAKTSLLQRTYPRLRSIATLIILCWTIPVSLLGCFLLCASHLLKGGNLIGIGKVASGRARNKKFHKTVIVAGGLSALPNFALTSNSKYCVWIACHVHVCCHVYNDECAVLLFPLCCYSPWHVCSMVIRGLLCKQSLVITTSCTGSHCEVQATAPGSAHHITLLLCMSAHELQMATLAQARHISHSHFGCLP